MEAGVCPTTPTALRAVRLFCEWGSHAVILSFSPVSKAMSATEPNEYEEARRRRMLRNEAVLQQLGLLENPMSGAAEQQRSQAAEQRRAARQWRQAAPAAPAGEQQVAAEPPRRSRRLQGEGAENAGANWGARPSERCG